MRILCHFYGCCEADEYPQCVRCGAVAYEYDPEASGPVLVEYGQSWHLWLAKWKHTLHRRFVAPFVPRRCWHCNRRLWPWSRSYNWDHCSDKCFSEWIPF